MTAGGRVRAGLTLAVALFCTSVSGQGYRDLSIEAIFDPAARVEFGGTPVTDYTWIDADTYITTQPVARGVEWVKVDAASGRTTPLFDAARMESALAALPDVTDGDAARLARSKSLILNPSHTGALFTIDDDLYVYEFASSAAVRLTSTGGQEEEPTFSPDGRLVAFVRGNNLFAVEISTRRDQALTTDGTGEILNGKLDWLYQEEIYGRGYFRGYWWSPDSSSVAFLQLDERPVPKYTVIDHIPYHPTLEVTSYPKAGDPNPLVRLGLARIAGGGPVWTDLGAYAGSDMLIVNVGWTPDSTQVVCQVQDREQTWLDLNMVDARTGHPRTLLRETTRAWVNENGNPVWLKDGSFLWLSERSGFKHLYHYRNDGRLIRQITKGRWDVRTFYGVREESKAIYFSAAERTPIGNDVYRVELGGGGFRRLSSRDGNHRAIFNTTFSRYIDVWSDVTTPPQVRLHKNDGDEIRTLEANRAAALAEYRLSKPEFLRVRTRDGFDMDAMIIKPPDFTPSRRYPVYQMTYSGPGTASVRNVWGGSTYMFHQLLAQHGVIVWVVDNRSASGRGVESQWPVYGNLGELELRDLEDGITWLKQQPYVDPSRIVLSGWSYGGFMTAYALTHSTSWSAGIAGAPVTDWRDYDTVYTERYMKTPDHNLSGYHNTAPRFAADQLHGRLLLIHGTIDDNVHTQNSEQFAYELQRAGKQFEMMIYPKSRHGVTDARLNLHLHQLMFDFVRRAAALPAAGTPVPLESR